MALSRLTHSGEIRRLRRGIYDRPQRHAVLGELPADPTAIAEAVARADKALLVPSGALAANALGIFTQVPASLVFRTTGGTRRIKIGTRTVELRHSTPGRLRSHNKTAAALIEALRTLGRANVTDHVTQTLHKRLSHKERASIIEAIPNAPAWMHPYLRKIARK
jgi:hypothetical protein